MIPLDRTDLEDPVLSIEIDNNTQESVGITILWRECH
jgi:hypothetical protein